MITRMDSVDIRSFVVFDEQKQSQKGVCLKKERSAPNPVKKGFWRCDREGRMAP